MCNHNCNNGGHGCCGGQMESSAKDKLAFLEHKEKMLEAKLEFVRKTKESLKSEGSSDEK